MIEPVALKDFLLVFWISAGILVFGLGYAGGYALAIARSSRLIGLLAYVAYGALLLCALALDTTLHFEGHWRLLTLALIVGYFWAPRLILSLTSATHLQDSSR